MADSQHVPPTEAFPSAGPPEEGTPTLDQVPVQHDPAATLAHGETGPPAAASEKLPTIPGFEVLRVLGRGGMGVVYLARQVALNRLIALKMVLAPEYASPHAHQRFLQEAAIVAKLQHPGIVQVHEFGTHEGHAYFAMEYVDGGSLEKLLAGTPQPPTVAATLIASLAETIHAAHERGIVHRDLKPANILLQMMKDECRMQNEKQATQTFDVRHSHFGISKITDFGLAKQLDASLTATGAIMGTPRYMAPEQAAGEVKKIGPATDVYALGVILYELLTGHPPFQAATAMETLHQVLSLEPVPPARVQPGVAKDLETICLKCLQKEPSKRYLSAKDLRTDLRCFLDGKPIAARPVTAMERAWRWSRRNPTVAGLMAAVFMLLVVSSIIAFSLAGWAFGERDRADGKAKEAEENRQQTESKRQEAEKNAVEMRSLSGSLRTLLDKQSVDNGMKAAQEGELFTALLWFVRPLKEGTSSEDTDRMARLRIASHLRYTPHPRLKQMLFLGGYLAGPVELLAFHPTEPLLATLFQDGTVRFWNVETGNIAGGAFVAARGAKQLLFSPDGSRLAVVGGDFVGLWQRVHGENGWRPGARISLKDVFHAGFNDDSRRLLLLTGKPGIRLTKPRGEQRVSYQQQKELTLHVREATTGQELVPPRKLPLDHPVSVAQFHAGGRMLLVAEMDGDRHLANTLFLLDVATGSRSFAIRPKAMVFQAGLPATGKRLALAQLEGEVTFWKWPGREVGQVPVTGTLKNVCLVAVSPDGVLAATASTRREVHVANTVHPGVFPSPTLHHGGQVIAMQFSPDGRFLAVADTEALVRVWDMAMAEEPLRALPGGVVALHKDQAALVADADGRVRLCPLDGKPLEPLAVPWQQTLRGGWRNPMLVSPDGRRVLLPVGGKQIAVHDAVTGRLVLPPLSHDQPVTWAEFSPDGQYIVTGTADATGNLRGQGHVRLWKATGEPLTPPLAMPGTVHEAHFDADSRRVVAACYTGAQVWDVVTGAPVTEFMAHGQNCYHACFSRNGLWVLTRGIDQHARAWLVRPGRQTPFLLTHEEHVSSLAFHPNTDHVLTTSWDQTARLWLPGNPTPVALPVEHPAEVLHGEFSPGGRAFVTVCGDERTPAHLRVWETATGQPLTPVLPHPLAGQARFSSDSWRLLSFSLPFSQNGTWQSWDLTPDLRPSADLADLAALLAGRNLARDGSFVKLRMERLQPAWERLRQRYPAEFQTPLRTVRRWREKQIGTCLEEGNVNGALLHQHWLLVEGIRETRRAR
jgi:eukaryotic-like serine/threonine-protein kinase